MQFEDTDLQEFIALWKEEFGETISQDEARHRASQVVELYMLLAAASRPPQSHGGDHESDSS